ncbi:MAG: NUDIX hydrolase, partial [Patescibacteria group bacterium]
SRLRQSQAVLKFSYTMSIMSNLKISPWQTIKTVRSDDFKIFSIETVRRISPRTNKEHEFYHINTADWLNIIAVTPDQKIVLIEQYRHGSDSVQLEIPGGMIEPGEDPSQAALRELAEETGYIGKEAIEIGRVNPNPALFRNNCVSTPKPPAPPKSSASATVSLQASPSP